LRAPALGGGLAALVVDAKTGRTLFARRPGVSLPPASTVKLLTAAAALTTLGPDRRLHTSVQRRGRTLVLVGGGDVTWSAAASRDYPVPATARRLASLTAAALDGVPGPFHLRYDANAWTGPDSAPGWTPSYFSAGDVARPSPRRRARPAGRVTTRH
jgi:D-alanyl-D-alanine carboxypeptidase/D-alanyl-D-alanine-endopeptidase (penicillin-binding protein 4)